MKTEVKLVKQDGLLMLSGGGSVPRLPSLPAKLKRLTRKQWRDPSRWPKAD